MYTDVNFPSKKALKDAVAAGQEIGVYQPGPYGARVRHLPPPSVGGNEPLNGEVSVEGPHYPKPHRWYARVTLKDGVIVKVK